MTEKGSEVEILRWRDIRSEGNRGSAIRSVETNGGRRLHHRRDPIDNVDALTLAKIIKWCIKHHDDDVKGHVLSEEKENEKEKGKELKKWESEFIDELNYDELYFLLTASNYMNVKELLGCTAQKVADMIKGKSPEKILEMFNIQNDFSKEEEEAIQKENQWAFD
ncbi:hypothetical protein QYF36_015155 [Acer negundo]|nr:hypothetical protein QYF36_015155 [Acer negundo]